MFVSGKFSGKPILFERSYPTSKTLMSTPRSPEDAGHETAAPMDLPGLAGIARRVQEVTSSFLSNFSRASINERVGQTFFSALPSSSSSSSSPRGSPDASPSPQRPGTSGSHQPRHLVVFVNGLFGGPANWSYIMDTLKSETRLGHDPSVLLHRSSSNQLLQTFEGIDVAGHRLAHEILMVVRDRPSLESISLVGHSMGGLIARYALGQLYSESPRTGQPLIAGLRPRHFVTIATPHIGCSADQFAPNRVPFIEWLGSSEKLGTVGGLMSSLFDVASVPVASLALRRTGKQFFLVDHIKGDEKGKGSVREPLLVRMTRDHETEGRFLSALAAFESRTAYANVDGDHLVGYANSSLRRTEELPYIDTEVRRTVVGVVREDPPSAGRWPASSSEEGVPSSFLRRVEAADPGLRSTGDAALSSSSASVSDVDTEMAVSRAMERRYHDPMLARLQALPWRRIDCCFEATGVRLLSHNLIQVTRPLLHSKGRPAVVHICKTLETLILGEGKDTMPSSELPPVPMTPPPSSSTPRASL